MLKFKGEFRVACTSSASAIRVTIMDVRARVAVAEVRMSLTQFAEALLGQRTVDCNVLFNDSGLVGMVCETKTLLVPIPKEFVSRRTPKDQVEKMHRELWKEFEVDGWKGRVDDALNHHRWRGNNSAEVVFTRWVPAPEGEQQDDE